MNRFYPFVLISAVISYYLFSMGIPGNVSAFGEKESVARYHAQTSLDSEYISILPVPKSVFKAINKGKWVDVNYPVPPTDVYISIEKEKKYAIDHQMNIYDLNENKAILELPDKVVHQLTKDMKKLYGIHYGDLITWNEANTALPRYSSFTVLDLDTGRTFEVQRRAGSYHADVQPLTNEDTKIMKEIYRGTWSWDRRAILILSQDHKYAASMHGMPHGKGALQNGFPGHFCIHFQDSITHKSRKMDHAHSIMIKKAAGEWIDHTEKLSPAEIVDATVLSIHQHDWFILASVLDDKNRILMKDKMKFLEEIDLVKRLSDLPAEHDYETKLYYPITVKLYIHRDTRGTESRQVTFQLYRGSIEEPWTLDLNNLIQQL